MLRDDKMLQNNLFKSKGPEYTIRMLLAKTIDQDKKEVKLKAFSHFTLGCTYEDETSKINPALDKLVAFFKDSVSFSAEETVNLGSDEKPLWAVKLSLGKNEEAVRTIFSAQFDSIMCPEKNGVTYLWQPKEGTSKKCPHVTIGPNKEDEAIAKRLVESKCEFLFNQIDYKRVGPHNPLSSQSLEYKSETNKNTI